MKNVNLNKLNVMNYLVCDLENGGCWYSCNGLRSLYHYSKNTEDMSFRQICERLLIDGQVVLKDYGVSISMI
jgi:hypothetical protein